MRAPLLLLLVTACAQPGETPTGAGERGFTPDGEAYTAATADLAVRVDAGGARLWAASDELGVTTLAWGRGDGRGDTRLVQPAPTRCQPVGEALVECPNDGVQEWWTVSEEGLEQGWTFTTPPEGEGQLLVELGLDGGHAVVVHGGLRVSGETGDVFGVSAPLAWDADGVSLPARYELTDAGFRVRVWDEGARYPVTIDPVYTTSSWTVSGDATSYMGYDSAVGDGNGDGYADIVSGGNIYGAYAGRVYVFNGRASGPARAASTNIDSPAASSNFGVYVAWGDFNGDGYDDVAASTSQTSIAGTVTVHLGSASGVSATATTTLTGPAVGSMLGQDLAAADINGDGYDELLAGAYAADSNAGRLYVYSGSAVGLVTGSPTIRYGSAANQYFGGGIATGDFDGDGYEDAVVYSRGTSSAGRLSLYRGSSAGLAASATTEINGVSSADSSGSPEASGDVDGDGRDDLLVVSPSYSSNAGRARVYLGAATGLSTSPHLTLTGAASNAYLGWSGGFADVDADGYADLAVASYQTNVTVYNGSAAGLGTSATQTLTGSGSFGASVSGGDVDGDGFDDLVVTNSDAYSAYVYAGYRDADGDGYASVDDCDDADATRSPGASDTAADGIDQNCDDHEWCYLDYDGDGYRSTSLGYTADTTCTASGVALATATVDCDDTAATAHAGASEVCDAANVDEDCDGLRDDADSSATGQSTFYVDADRDGYGGAGGSTSACDAPTGYAALATDCDDGSSAVYPGATDTAADGVDSNCDGVETCYVDADDDGHRTTATVSSTSACAGTGEALGSDPADDCDDTAAAVNPSATETTGDGIDADCDGHEVCYADSDGDGHGGLATSYSADTDCADAGEASTGGSDCDDGDASAHPGATEAPGDGVDGDCDGAELCYTDADDDGYRSSGTVVSTDTDCRDAGEATDASSEDCDDADGAVHPGATEAIADGVDGNCDGAEDCYADADGDGYRTATTVSSADGDCADAGEADTSAPAGDCDDAVATTFPGAAETPADGVDSDCNGGEVCYTDGDADGWRADTTVASVDADCTDGGEAVGSMAGGDCDDGRSDVNPGATEAVGDEVDGDCDGGELCLADRDDDGARTDETVISADADCRDPGEAVPADGVDCDDADDDISPDADEIVGDDVDSDCDGAELCYADADGDGYRSDEEVESADVDCHGAGEAVEDADEDCDDAEATIHAGATDTPGDGIDQDCNGVDAAVVDTGDPDEDPDDGDAKDGGTDCGCATSSDAGTLAAGLGALALVLRRRRPALADEAPRPPGGGTPSYPPSTNTLMS